MSYYSSKFSLGAWVVASAFLFSLSACSKKDGASSSGGAPVPGAAASASAEDSLQTKLGLYIECYNKAGVSFPRSIERYESWVKNMDTGPTGKETHVYGLPVVWGTEECQKAVEKAKGLSPAMPELEQAAAAFAASLLPLQATIAEANAYYERENYKDDGFAKGKALHKPLVEQANAFSIANKQFSDALDEANDARQQAQLQRMEKESGRNLAYLHLATMLQAKALLGLLLEENVNVAEAGEKIDAFEKLLDEMKKSTDTKPSTWSWYISSTEEFCSAAKELWRRQRDKTPYTSGEKMLLKGDLSTSLVSGSPGKLLDKYNSMIDKSNGLR